MDQPNAGQDLRRIHLVISRGVQVATEAAGIYAREGYPDGAIREGFWLYVRALLVVLDAHHAGEDEVAWPFLREKMPDAPYEQLIAEHREIDKTLNRLRETLDGEVRLLLAPLLKLQQQWDEHRSLEEMSFSPEATEAALAPADHVALSQQLGAHAQAHSEPPEIVIPFVLYNLPPEERTLMMQSLPPAVVKELIPGPWQEAWGPMRPFLLMSIPESG